MNSKTPRYRLSTRDLQWGSRRTAPIDKKAPAPVAVTSDESQSFRVSRAIDLLYLPHVGEHLARISTYDLAAWQRTCAWARGWRIQECVVRTPRAIVPFMDDGGTLDEDGQEILLAGKEAKRTEDELRALGIFAGDDPGELNLKTLLGEIAALAIFGRTKWGLSHRAEIRQQALASPEMSYYFAAATDLISDEWLSLIQSISACPRFSYAALNLPHLPISAPLLNAREKLRKSVKQDAILHWALEFNSFGQDKTSLTENIIETPDPTGEACALSIALAPHHPRVPEWIFGLAGQPQLAYETRRLLSLSNQLDPEFLLAPKLVPIAMTDPRWAFHWMRDFSEGDEEAVASLLPHLEWIAELIDIGVCSLDLATLIDDRAAQTFEMDHWRRSSFLLHAASKVKADD